MGYDSTFSGSMRPSKPIPPELAERINDRCDLRVMEHGDEDCDGDIGDIVPVMRIMHGYNLATDVFRVQRLLRPHGITLTGEIFRAGEAGGDFEKVEAVKGRIYVRGGEVVYGKRKLVSIRDVAYYAIRIMLKSETGKTAMLGWLAPGPLPLTGKACETRPPEGAYRFSTPEKAKKLLSKRKARKTVTYEITRVEDTL